MQLISTKKFKAIIALTLMLITSCFLAVTLGKKADALEMQKGMIDDTDCVVEESGDSVSLKFNSDEQVFVYGRIIDLDNVFTLKLSTNPLNRGTWDFDKLYVDLVDINNPENYIRHMIYKAEPGLNEFRCYIRSGVPCAGQELTGTEKKSDEIQQIWTGSWGTPTWLTFANGSEFTISYDNEYKTSYTSIWGDGNLSIIADYDDEKYFGNNVWSGFSTNYAYLRVSVDEFQSVKNPYANVLINKVNGKTVKEDLTDIDSKIEISVDYKDYLFVNQNECTSNVTDDGVNIVLKSSKDAFSNTVPVAFKDGYFSVLADVKHSGSSSRNADNYYFDLIDSKNLSNYLSVRYKVGNDDKIYVAAYVPGVNEDYISIDKNGDVDYSGCQIETTLKADGKNSVFIKYSKKENALYVSSSGVENGNFVKVIDFNNKVFDKKWNGFESDNLYVRVKASGFNEDKAEILLKKVNGETPSVGEDIVPEICVGAKYTFLDAVCIDTVFNTAVKKEYKVTFNGNAVEVTGNSFVPENVGEYDIEIIASNDYGKTASFSYKINVKENASTYNFDFVIPETIKQGEYCVPSYERATAFSEEYVKYYLVDGTTETEFDDSIQLLKVGSYTVKGVFVDHTGAKQERTKTITVEKNNKPFFGKELNCPNCLYKDETYKITTPKAYVYNEDGTTKEVIVIVSVTEGTDEKYISGEYSTKDLTVDKVKFKYIAFNGDESCVLVKEVKIKHPYENTAEDASIDLKEYFDGENVITELSEEYIEFSFNEDTTLSFGHTLAANDFSMKFAVKDGFANLSYFTVVLTDSEDSDCSVSFKYQRNSLDKGSASVTNVFLNNGKKENSIDGTFYGTDYSFKYDNVYKRIVCDNGSEISIDKTLAGDKFEGFKSGKIYLSFIFDNVYDTSVFMIKEICEQKFNESILNDVYDPIIVPLDSIGGIYYKNKEIVIPRAVAYDVLSANTTLKMTVSYQSNFEIARDVNGTTLENVDPLKKWVIKTDKYESFIVKLTAYDRTGRDTSYTYIIATRDLTPPTITLKEDAVKEVNVGEQIKVPSFTVVDDVKETECETTVWYVTPGNVTYKYNGRYIQADEKGYYRIKILAYDASGNMSVKEYYVLVK